MRRELATGGASGQAVTENHTPEQRAIGGEEPPQRGVMREAVASSVH